MKICFVWYFNKADWVYPLWRDGLRKAIEIIAKEHEVDWVLGEKLPEDKYDAIIFWGDSNCPFFNHLDNYQGKKAICLTTYPYNSVNLAKLDAVYCESEPIYENVRRYGIRAIKAFGTDEEFFKPIEAEKSIPYFYPATFSPWKRQSAIAHLGPELFCIGTLQPDGTYELEECKKNHVRILVGYVPVEEIREYYSKAKEVLIPAVHGSERTCLEALSMGIVPQVNKDNKRTYSYIEELKASGLSPREFIVQNYSAKKYAQNILKGIT